MEDFDDYGYIRLDKRRYLRRHVTCIRSARKCDILSFGLRCERIECTQQHYPIMFRVDGYMLTGPEYQSYLFHGTVPEIREEKYA